MDINNGEYLDYIDSILNSIHSCTNDVNKKDGCTDRNCIFKDKCYHTRPCVDELLDNAAEIIRVALDTIKELENENNILEAELTYVIEKNEELGSKLENIEE